MTARPLVTIGLPFISTPLGQFTDAVRSIYAQTYDEWELLLVADGPVPDLQDLVTTLGEADPRVRVVLGEDNRGLATRLNEVADLARGEYLLRMDGDDVSHPDRLATLVERATSGPPVDVLGSHAYLIDADTRILGRFREGPLGTTQAAYLRSNQFSHPTVLLRTEWARRHRYDPSLHRSEDKELWLRAFPGSAYAKLDDHLLFYRVADLSVAKQARDARHDRSILRSHGTPLVGRRRTTVAVARSMARQAVFAAMVTAGQEERIQRRKCEPVDPVELAAAQDALAVATGADVPGWPPPTRTS